MWEKLCKRSNLIKLIFDFLFGGERWEVRSDCNNCDCILQNQVRCLDCTFFLHAMARIHQTLADGNADEVSIGTTCKIGFNVIDHRSYSQSSDQLVISLIYCHNVDNVKGHDVQRNRHMQACLYWECSSNVIGYQWYIREKWEIQSGIFRMIL